MLERARSMLRPGGIVLIAIENQLGLKYFAGAPEDHVARRMFGLEDRYTPDGVQTFGRYELTRLTSAAGFTGARVYAPFPDYKFPVTIFSEDGLTDLELDPSSMLWPSLFSDRQLTNYLSFDLQRVWDVVVRNKLGIDLANSFLLMASTDTLNASPELAWHYSDGRAPYFCKSLVFTRVGDEIQTSTQPLQPSSANPVAEQLRIEHASNIPFVKGTPLSRELHRLLTTEGWRVGDLVGFVKRYLTIAEKLVRNEGCSVSLAAGESALPGRFMDLVPPNIIRTESDEFQLIDREWAYQPTVSVDWLVFRALVGQFCSLPAGVAACGEFQGTRLELMIRLFDALGFAGGEARILELGRAEATMQSLVVGKPIAGDSWNPDLLVSRPKTPESLPIFSFEEVVSEYERMLQIVIELNQFIETSQEDSLTPIDRLRRERDQLLAQISNLRTERDHYERAIREVERSFSWRITGPLRNLKARLAARD
jgi:hypothetical protein